jgi:DNA polymerase (family X)
MPDSLPSNASIAALLDLIADHLAAKDENPFRVRSYRTAAASVRSSKTPIGKIVKEHGSGALKGVPGVGERLAGLIEETQAADSCRDPERMEVHGHVFQYGNGAQARQDERLGCCLL